MLIFTSLGHSCSLCSAETFAGKFPAFVVVLVLDDNICRGISGVCCRFGVMRKHLPENYMAVESARAISPRLQRLRLCKSGW